MKFVKFIAVAAIAVAVVASCGKTQKKNTIPGITKETVDSVSYLVGVNFGAQLKHWKAADNLDELNLAEVKKGMEDFLKAKGTPNPYDSTFTSQFKIDLKHMDRILGDYINKRVEYKNEQAKKASDAFLAENAKKADVSTTESGLQYTIIEAGAAEKVGASDTVKVNYKGCLADGTVFDENQGIEFVANQVIPGWTEGLGLIGEGGKIKLYIPSDLGYGDRDLPTIPANSVLIFDVEVLEVKPSVSDKTQER